MVLIIVVCHTVAMLKRDLFFTWSNASLCRPPKDSYCTISIRHDLSTKVFDLPDFEIRHYSAVYHHLCLCHSREIWLANASTTPVAFLNQCWINTLLNLFNMFLKASTIAVRFHGGFYLAAIRLTTNKESSSIINSKSWYRWILEPNF